TLRDQLAGRGHHLHEPAGAGTRNRVWVEDAFLANQPASYVRINTVAFCFLLERAPRSHRKEYFPCFARHVRVAIRIKVGIGLSQNERCLKGFTASRVQLGEAKV